MDVALEAIDGTAVETYHVRMQESDSSGNHVVLGIVERESESTWGFRAAHPMMRRRGEAPSFRDEARVTLTARDRAELEHVIGQRFGTFDLPADRLRDDTTARISYDVLHGMLQLARRTNSIGGFSKALAQVVALIVAEDLRPEQEGAYRGAMRTTIDQTIVNIREAKRVSAEIAGQLASMFKPHADDDESQPLKH